MLIEEKTTGREHNLNTKKVVQIAKVFKGE